MSHEFSPQDDYNFDTLSISSDYTLQNETTWATPASSFEHALPDNSSSYATPATSFEPNLQGQAENSHDWITPRLQEAGLLLERARKSLEYVTTALQNEKQFEKFLWDEFKAVTGDMARALAHLTAAHAASQSALAFREHFTAQQEQNAEWQTKLFDWCQSQWKEHRTKLFQKGELLHHELLQEKMMSSLKTAISHGQPAASYPSKCKRTLYVDLIHWCKAWTLASVGGRGSQLGYSKKNAPHFLTSWDEFVESCGNKGTVMMRHEGVGFYPGYVDFCKSSGLTEEDFSSAGPS